MPDVMEFKPGDYRFIVSPGGPFSAGVAAMPGFGLRRVRFLHPIPMADGFAFIKRHLGHEGRPVTALAACELRSPAAMTGEQFQKFNGEYLKTLHDWGCKAGEINPLARSNLAPITEIPNEAMFFAFTYTVPESGASGDFLISGKPEIRDGAPPAERIVGGRDVSLKGLEVKARFVMDAMRERVAALGCDWARVTAAQIYTVHDVRPLLDTVFAESSISQIGLAWYPAWPPVIGMEFEVDVRSVRAELVIAGR
ncbi:hypothetical protein [Bradyrhizobium sp. G127]|uniref:2-amino-5-chloromuconate deaminase CnbZ n=1 Tax=Bradyrhizobium sp. G127 TaxID=2904800 RepID=UPI001F4526A4|nr:hypothetical protein [Bradyrhizobium sp. G127]MCF2523335.1 hypothetical protein [Bradyrhizobium sp. G127]